MLLLTGCNGVGEWFYHEVDFDAEIEASELVLSGTLRADDYPVLVLSHSLFFLDSIPLVKPDTLAYSSATGEVGIVTGNLPEIPYRGYVYDALVEMKVDDEEWTTMRPDKRYRYLGPHYSSLSYNYYEPMPVYTSDRLLRPGNKVTIRASHPDYPNVAVVTQTIPQRLPSEVDFLRIDTFRMTDLYNYRHEYLLSAFQLTLPPYTGDPTNRVSIRAKAYRTRVDYYEEHSQSHNSGTYFSTLGYTTSIYGKSALFAEYNNTNQALTQGHYGAEAGGLICSHNLSGSPIQIPIWADYTYTSWRDGGNSCVTTIRTDSIVIEVASISQDAYLLTSTLQVAGYGESSEANIRDYWAGSLSYYEDYVQSITDIFETLGGMEGVQVYHNVDGGLGCVTAIASRRFVFRRGIDYE